MLTEKDLIVINKQFSNGHIVNPGSLDFVLYQTHRSRHWFKTMCSLVRTISLDHVFEDGNKRTATAVVISYLETNKYNYSPDIVSRVILQIVKSNIKDIRIIGRLIKNAIK